VIQERNRPFTARSVLASALLGMEPPVLPVAQLVRLTGLFGINPNRARVALSRMVAAGEVTTDGSGTYRLAGRLQERQARQSASRAGSTVPFSGQWWLAVVVTKGSTAGIRTARRASLAYARLAELREGVWMRPANVELHLPEDLGHDVELLSTRPEEPERLVSALWDLGAWAARAGHLLETMDALSPDTPESLAPGFEFSASVLRHLQADPLLPEELLPPQWPGTRLRTEYDRWDARYRATLRDWSRA
jgi:phenylacetic acid degradation operon negative regulatory protein